MANFGLMLDSTEYFLGHILKGSAHGFNKAMALTWACYVFSCWTKGATRPSKSNENLEELIKQSTVPRNITKQHVTKLWRRSMDLLKAIMLGKAPGSNPVGASIAFLEPYLAIWLRSFSRIALWSTLAWRWWNPSDMPECLRSLACFITPTLLASCASTSSWTKDRTALTGSAGWEKPFHSSKTRPQLPTSYYENISPMEMFKWPNSELIVNPNPCYS